MPTHQPQGRKARAEPSSRKGQFYDSPIEKVYNTTQGELSVIDFKRKLSALDPGAKFSAVKERASCMRFSRKTCACGWQIQMHGDGRAVCNNPRCSTVFNDGGSTLDEHGKSLLKITNHYSDGRITEAPPPRKRSKSDMHHIMRAVA